MDEQELSLSLGQRRTLLIYLSGLFPLGIRLLVRNSPVCESKHCNANGRNRSHLLIAGHRDDVQDCREAAQVARFPSVANAAPRSQTNKASMVSRLSRRSRMPASIRSSPGRT